MVYGSHGGVVYSGGVYGGGVHGARGGMVVASDLRDQEADEACGGCCFEGETEPLKTEERWVYVGDGRGSYAQATNMHMVGPGKGDFEKETRAHVAAWKCRACCVAIGCFLFVLAVLLPIGWVNNWWIGYFEYFDMPDECTTSYSADLMARTDAKALSIRHSCCAKDYPHFCVQPATPKPQTIVIHDQYYTQVKDVPVPHTVPVPVPAPPPKVITHKVLVHTHAFNCDSSLSDYMHTWTPKKQRYCCYLRQIGCKTKVTYRPHYHTITKVKNVKVPVHVPIPAPPAQVVNKVVNVPIHDPPKVIKVPVPGEPHVVHKYIHKKVPMPVPQPSPPKYHNVPVPVKVVDPGKTIKVPVPLPPQTVVKNRVIYKTRHVNVQHIYDCKAGYSNWHAGWSSAKKSWCCDHENRGCPGDHSGHLTKTIVTHVTSHMGPEYYSHHDSDYHHVHVHHYHNLHHATTVVHHHYYSGSKYDQDDQSGSKYDHDDQSGSKNDHDDQSGSKYDHDDHSGSKYDHDDHSGSKYDQDDQSGSKYDHDDHSGSKSDQDDQSGSKYDQDDQSGSKYDHDDHSGSKSDQDDQSGSKYDHDDHSGSKLDHSQSYHGWSGSHDGITVVHHHHYHYHTPEPDHKAARLAPGFARLLRWDAKSDAGWEMHNSTSKFGRAETRDIAKCSQNPA